MCSQNHTHAVDFFALGVIAFELMLGKRPYLGKSRKEIKEKILAGQVKITQNDLPEGWSIEAADFANRLLQRKPKDRLGLLGAKQVKEHSWLKYYPWKDLYEKKVKSPFIPVSQENFDSKYCNEIEKLGVKTKEKYEEFRKSETYITCFNNFKHYNYEEENKNDEGFKNPHDGSQGDDKDEGNSGNAIDLNKSNESPTSRSRHERNLSMPVNLSNQSTSLSSSSSFLKNYESPTKNKSSMLTTRKNFSVDLRKSSDEIYHIKII